MSDARAEAAAGGAEAAAGGANVATAPAESRSSAASWGWPILGLIVLLGLGALARFLDLNVSVWAAGTPLAKVSKAIEYPIYAIMLGLLGNLVLTLLGVRDRMSPAFRTEFLIKTGLVLLGASINLSIIV